MSEKPPTDTLSALLVTTTPVAPAVLYVGQSVSLTLAGGEPTRTTLPAAEIYTYGHGYDALGIGAGFSCLYLFFDATGTLTAKMVAAPHQRDDQHCGVVVIPDTLVGRSLPVVGTQLGTVSADYPAAARWDYDIKNVQYYIGIKCGDAWCEVGAPPADRFRLSRTVAYDKSATPEENRVVRVKGWYDQQNLAMDAPSGDVAVPSGIVATVVPHPALASATYPVGQWVLSAYVGMDTTNATPNAVKRYKTKYNFDPVPVALPLRTMNTLSFCYGRRKECQVPEPPSGQGCHDSTFGIPFARVWWVKIEAALDHHVIYRCGTRRGPTVMTSDVKTPPTVRWRWVADDETVWAYCMSHYCCEVGPDSFSAGWSGSS